MIGTELLWRLTMSKTIHTPLITFQMSFSGNLFQRTPDNLDYDRDALPDELLWLIEQQLTSHTHPGIYFKEKNPKFFGMAKVSENFVQQNFRNNF